MIFVLHVDDEVVSDRIDIHTIEVPPNKPYRFNDDFIAEKFLEHKWYHGLVQVEQAYDDEKGSFTLNLDKARADSAAKLEKADEAMISQYVRTQLEDRVAVGRPPLPPSGRVERILERRKVDLAATYGIRPVGWKGKIDYNAAPSVEAGQVADLMKMVTTLLAKSEAQDKVIAELQKAVS